MGVIGVVAFVIIYLEIIFKIFVSEINRSVANKFTMSQSFLKYNIYEKLVK